MARTAGDHIIDFMDINTNAVTTEGEENEETARTATLAAALIAKFELLSCTVYANEDGEDTECSEAFFEEYVLHVRIP
jgi:hypothetical protein